MSAVSTQQRPAVLQEGESCPTGGSDVEWSAASLGSPEQIGQFAQNKPFATTRELVMPVGNLSRRTTPLSPLEQEVYRLECIRIQSEVQRLLKCRDAALGKSGEALGSGVEKELRQQKEEFELLSQRLQLFKELVDSLSIDKSTAKLKLEEGLPRAPSRHTELAPNATALHGNEDMSTELLSMRLATRLRERLHPTLKDKLTGLDSPLSPPGVITDALEEVLVEYMLSLDESRRHSLIEVSYAMLALQRGLAIRMTAEVAGKGGAVAREAQIQAASALASANAFEMLLSRAKYAGGARLTVHFGEQSVELRVHSGQTMLQLVQTAARYCGLHPPCHSATSRPSP
jgi:hypothetical protein